MQATLQAGNPEPAEEDKDDVDVLLDELVSSVVTNVSSELRWH